MKCFFNGLDEICDMGCRAKVKTAVESLVSENNEMEFVFYRIIGYTRDCLHIVFEVKQLHPEKRIRIVRVAENGWEYELAYHEWFYEENGKRICYADDMLLAPVVTGKSANRSELFIVRAKQVEKWAAEQCECMISYTYAAIYHNSNAFEQSYSKGKNKRVISVSSPEREEGIKELYKLLPERDRFVMTRYSEGKSLTEIGKAIERSREMVRQIAVHASQKIRSILIQQMPKAM